MCCISVIPYALFIFSVFKRIEGDYPVYQKNLDSLFTTTSLEEIILGYPHKFLP
jgi:hypothetical protein